jgi:hypothetical protein
MHAELVFQGPHLPKRFMAYIQVAVVLSAFWYLVKFHKLV